MFKIYLFAWQETLNLGLFSLEYPKKQVYKLQVKFQDQSLCFKA